MRRQLGRVPNLYAAMANSPATLRGYLRLRDALTTGKLSARTRERLALNVLSNYFNHLAQPDLDFPPVASAGSGMSAGWRPASKVTLVEGYTLLDENGSPSSVAEDVDVAIEGGFLHVRVAGSTEVQVVSAPAVALVNYRAARPCRSGGISTGRRKSGPTQQRLFS